MIMQSPESDMPEPYKTYVRHRNATIAEVLTDVINDDDIQLCPRAILEEERIFDHSSLVYGAVVRSLEDGYKTVLYRDGFRHLSGDGTVISSPDEAMTFASSQFKIGNRVRVKDPRESDGNGQFAAETPDELHQAVEAIMHSGSSEVVLMPHLRSISHRVSVGHIDLGRFGSFSYIGNEQQIRHAGNEVYGGTSIGLFGGNGAETLRRTSDILDLPHDLAEIGVQAIKKYSGIATHLGRVSVDVMRGETDSGQTMSVVTDITPRVGGVTPAEVLALREIVESGDPDAICLATSTLLYNPQERPVTGSNFVDTDSLIINARVSELLK